MYRKVSAKKTIRTVNVKGESIVKGGKCTTEKMSLRPHTVTAKLFFSHGFPQFGLHSKVISDRAPQFASAFVQELACLLQYNVTLSTTYHPQTDGETE